MAQLALLLVASVSAASVVSDNQNSQQNAGNLAMLDSPALQVISDADKALMQEIKHHITVDFTEFKSINDVHMFLDNVKLLVQKHPKNVAFAQANLKELLKFLSQEIITKLIRVDTDPFVMPLTEDKFALAQRAVDEDELTRKLFGAPLRSLIEARRQQLSRTEDGNHKDGNFFSNFWCKLSGSCPNQ